MRRTSFIIAAAASTALSAALPARAEGSGWGGQVRFTASVDAGIGQTKLGHYVRVYEESDYWEQRTRGKGLALGANFGVEVGRDWAFQLEAQYLGLDRNLFLHYGGEIGTIMQDQEDHLFAGFVTGQYRIPMEGYFRPYLGLGLGFLTHDFGSDGDDYLWATKFQLGGDLAVGDTISLYGQYDMIAAEGKFDQTNSLIHVGRVGLKKRF
ncbi:hypothetical protein [Neomegalonema sp.]|uniref:hypothetical protein n=1 Tax=Neomegalonema sp. TaxID=2039713 RepID=UPI0026376B0E|nr:hypothetical protein [Neomegalonema sp.]MDD2868611.1 hypothetical protein [Neomegalonema sp.]